MIRQIVYLITLRLHTYIGMLLLCHGLLSVSYSSGHVLHLSGHQVNIIWPRLTRVHIWIATSVSCANIIYWSVGRLIHIAHYKQTKFFLIIIIDIEEMLYLLK